MLAPRPMTASPPPQPPSGKEAVQIIHSLHSCNFFREEHVTAEISFLLISIILQMQIFISCNVPVAKWVWQLM